MFLAPQSRVAYWNGWEMFGLSKRDYDAVHSTFMLLFLTSVTWHTVLNWRFLVDYLRTGARKLVVFTPELILAVAVCMLFFVGTVSRSIPFEQYLGVASSSKRYWRESLGSPPWPPADATPLYEFCRGIQEAERYTGKSSISVDCADAVAALRQSGIAVEDVSQPLNDIAAANGTTPRAVADVVLSVARPVADVAGEPPPE